MKFELTFKVVLLFSYQGFALMRKLLYFITSTFVCQELFSTSFFEIVLFSSSVFFRRSCSFMSCNFYILSHMFYLVKNFFHLSEDFLSDFFQINVLSCATYVIISQQYNYVKLFLIFFLFCKKRWILYLFYNGTRITPSLTLLS